MRTGERRGRGRPRVPEVDDDIHDAVLRVLKAVGYSRLTFELVAEAAGVSRPTVYRRGSGKAALVVAALTERFGLQPVPDTGTLRDDLLALQRHQVAFYNDPVITATLPALLADIRVDEASAAAWRDGFVGPRRAGTIAAARRAKERGELRTDVDDVWICEVLTGPLVTAAFLSGPAVLPETLAEQTVNLVLATYGA